MKLHSQQAPALPTQLPPRADLPSCTGKYLIICLKLFHFVIYAYNSITILKVDSFLVLLLLSLFWSFGDHPHSTYGKLQSLL